MNQINIDSLEIGDRVVTSDGWKGCIVCNIEDSKYSNKYPKKDWEYLNSGVLIMTDEAGLIYYPSTSKVKKIN